MNSFKTFTDFGKGLVEVSEFIPEIKEIATSVNEDISAITPKDLAGALIEIVMNDFPYIDFRSPAVSVSYKEVGYKSKSVLSFGWKYINDGSGKMSYSFRISFYSRAHNIEEIEKKLVEAGWTQSGDKKTFFPYKQSNNFHKKDGKDNKEFTSKKKRFNKKNEFNNNNEIKAAPTAPAEVKEVTAEPKTVVEEEF